MTPAERTIAIRGGQVSFRVLRAGDGPPLVYFQSLFERRPWTAFLDHLAERRTVHVPLLPGAQGSDGIESIHDLFDLVLVHDELLSALDVPSADLVGHGFGGLLAAEIAAVFPARARRLVLMSPLGIWRDDAPSADVLILPPDDLAGVLWSDPRGGMATEWARLPAESTAAMAVQLESVQRRAAVSKFVWPIPDSGIARRLHRVTAPALILWGDSDQANPPVYAEEWRGRLADARVRSVPGGHMLVEESPGEIAQRVLEFLRIDV